MVTPVIGAEVPVSPEGRKRQEGRGRDRRTDLRRQAIERNFRVLFGASREEAPEEWIYSSATRLPNLLVRPGEQSETREWSTQEGPRNIGRFWAPEAPVFGSEMLRNQAGQVERPASLRAT